MNFYKNNNKYNLNDNNNEFIINSNYVYNIIKNKMGDNAINLNIEDINKIKYILRLVDVCQQIRAKYILYIVLNTKINSVYNVNNEYLIFMGEKYFFVKYLLKEKEFIPLIKGKFIENDKDNFNNYEINHICQKYIILNNFKEKIINFIDINIFSILNKKLTYYLNFIANDNYLLYDNIKDNELLFSLINLSDLSNEKNNNLLQSFNYKIDNNIPKLLTSNSFKDFIFLYDNNQLCIDEYILYNEINIKKNKNIKKINIKKNELIIPFIEDSSEVYSKDYDASKLFSEDNYYYCSKNNSKQFIIFDCKTEYYFKSFKITYYSKNNCQPKNFIVTILDNKKKIINIHKFCNENNDELENTYEIQNKGRYIKFDILDNFGGDYIIIKKLKFNVYIIDSIL